VRMAVSAERMRRCIGGWVGSRPCEECLMVEHPKLAICAIVKDEARYIEWLAFHFLQGVSPVLIFDNESTDGTRDILEGVARHLPISVVNWPGQDYYQVQMEARWCDALDRASRLGGLH
jgi:hypothetical protein